MQYYLEILIFDPSIYTLDYLESTVTNFVEVSFAYKELSVLLVHVRVRVKSGKFGHTFANSGNPDETALLKSRLIRIFTVCLVNLFFIPITEL